jgi:O-glycosyl hydrolase
MSTSTPQPKKDIAFWEKTARNAQEELATERQKTESLGKELSALKPDHEEDLVQILSTLADNPAGMTLKELSEKTGKHPERVRFTIRAAEKQGYMLAHGGGDDPLFYKIQDPGRLLLMSKGVI